MRKNSAVIAGLAAGLTLLAAADLKSEGPGAATIGRLNSAWARMGTTSSASTVGQTTGPPAEKA